MRLTKRELESLRSTFARAQRVTKTAFHLKFVPTEPDGEDDKGAVYRIDRSETRGDHDATMFVVSVYPEWRTSSRRAKYTLAVHEILHAMVRPMADMIGGQFEKIAEQREETLVYQLQRALVGDSA